MDQEEILIGKLSVAGKPIYMPMPGETYEGPYTVTPQAHNNQVLGTSGLYMTNNVTVFKVPYFEVSNEKGLTVYIAQEVNNG